MTPPPSDVSASDELPRWAARLSDEPESVMPLWPAGARETTADESGDEAHGRPPPKSGILNIDKPSGQTSHDVVQAVRRAAGVRRVGHAGTLDPLATGVLVVCVGSATRVIEEIQAGEKAYRARVSLGASTTTYDGEGEAVESCDPSGVTRADVEAALEPLRGEIWQVPPMYSAVKHEGKRLYELARKGIEVERQPRQVTVHELNLAEWEPPELVLEMRVTKGTYVRTLAHDLGTALGVGAHLASLRRTAVGRFSVEESDSLVRVVESFGEGWWPQVLYPLDTALIDYPALIVSDADETAIRHGQQVDGPAPAAPAAPGDGPPSGKAPGPAPPGQVPTAAPGHPPARAYSQDGQFIGLLRWDDVTRRWQPSRVFPKPS